jgi:hypothetical protein
MRTQILSILSLLLLLGAACTPSESLPKADRLATIVASTLTARPTFTSIPAFTATLPATPLPTDTALGTPVGAGGTVYVRTIVQNVNLRTQPGMLFPVSRVMPQGTRLQVFGLSPGGEWVYVLNDEGVNGWVGLSLVDAFPVEQFPSVDPADVQRVTGRVLDANGLPVSGIGYALKQQSGSKTLRTDAVTDATGTFYAYLPKSASGVWTVSYVSVACTSNTMDANCNCLSGACGASYPVSVSISLPVNAPLAFTWK